MIVPQQEFLKLLSLTRSFLSMEFKGGELLVADSSTYDFFKQRQSNAVKKQAVEPPPQQQQQRSLPLPQEKLIDNRVPAPSLSPAPEIRSQKAERAPLEQCLNEQPAEPAPPPPPIAASPVKERRFSLKLEPLTEVKETDLTSVRKEAAKLFPEKQQLDPPDDAIAKRMAQQWKLLTAPPEVVILSFQENEEQQLFLQNVKTAINQRLAPCAIYSSLTIETRQAWDKLFLMKDLRLIITTDYALYALPGLMGHYRESSEKAQRYLGGIPLLVLADISLYLKQPQLKAALWQAICRMASKGPL